MLCLLFSLKCMLGLLSFYQLPQHNAFLLPAPPQCSDSRQTNRDLLPQIHGKASKDTIPSVYSIKTHHTHKTTKISLYWTFRPEKRNSTCVGQFCPVFQLCERKGPAQYPVWGETNIRGHPAEEWTKLPSEERWSMFVRNWAVSEDDGHLGTFVRGA